MGILNNTSDGIHGIVAVLYRALVHFGPTDRAKLIELCSCGLDSGDGAPKVRNALARWEDLGLFQESPKGMCIPPDLEPHTKDNDAALTEALRCAVLSIVFTPRNTQDLWGTEGSSDFARGVAWWLAQDPYRLDTGTQPLLRLERSQVQIAERRIVINDVRMSRLGEWAAFLGFTWSAQRGRFTPDPTEAIDRVLEKVLAETNQEMPAMEFVQSLAAILPVLDQGSHRRAVEAELRPDVWGATPEGWVSQTLGLALRRLESKGRLRLLQRADVGSALQIPGRGGTSLRALAQFTHVLRTEVTT
ncbi:hypothetical protein EJP67_10760 [Variovorax guangxiensis]|uniref:Uncharacterized protein n=1 Tax=Variovorax guangxiensis TaxID=1775474 RepID=A0A433MIK0_9BURK|nr:protein DpdG [Variovorax guangxiensis]RUR67535.1 hypothetical protein EJP67_10760 [Variovorax guangxiensis]